ncbi:MAG: hypothetical protein EOM50_02125 [Erysipelotrichia bacterium]|nr:hypothetical protein [Erysipelotrichia bacterium]
MDKTVKFKHHQTFKDEDYVPIKCAIKGKTSQSNRQQVPTAFFIIFASLSFMAYTKQDTFAFIMYIGLLILCVAYLFFIHYVDCYGVYFYKLVLMKTMMNDFTFYEQFMECHNTYSTTIILYEQIAMIYEQEQMLFVRIKGKEKNVQFLLKKGMNPALYAFLKERFKERWQIVGKEENFLLK